MEKYNQLKKICNAFLINKISKSEFTESYVEITEDERHKPKRQTEAERKEYMKEYDKKYYEKNKEKSKADRKKYMKEYNKKYYEKKGGKEIKWKNKIRK